MIGDNIVDDTCWVVKTHHPTPKIPGTKDFTANKCIVCVRNPFDIIISCFNFYVSNYAHSVTLQNDPFAPENAELFNKLIEDQSSRLN